MHKNRVFFRIVSLLLVLAACAGALVPMRTQAKDYSWVEIKAYAIDREVSGLLTLMLYDGELYIYSEDARVLSGASHYVDKENGRSYFTFTAEKIYTEVPTLALGTRKYFHLKELMDKLKTRYYYDTDTQMLYFLPCTSFVANLKNDCMGVYCESGFDVAQIESTFGVVLASTYNILGGLRVDALWGNYTKELYEEALIGIMQGDEDDDVMELMSTGDELLGKLASLVELNKTDITGAEIEGVLPLFSYETDEFLEWYGEMSENDDLQELGIGAALEAVQRINAGRHAKELYVNAVRIGIVNRDVNYLLARAADEVIKYFDENTPNWVAVLGDLSSTVLNETGQEVVTEVVLLQALRSGQYYKLNLDSLYVELFKMLLDRTGLGDQTRAVEMTRICRVIQDQASDAFHESMKNDANAVSYVADPVKMKYSTILYLRACQYAYEQYEFDKTLGPHVRVKTEQCAEAIRELAAYDDEELTMTVDNPVLQLGNMDVTISQTPSPTPVPTDAVAATPTPTPRKPKEFLFSDCAIADGEYKVTVSKDELRTISGGWSITAEVYEKIGIDQAAMNELQVGDTIGGYAVEKMDWQKGTWQRQMWISDEYYLLKGYDGVWYLHMRDDDLFVLRQNKQREMHILRDQAELYDNFTYIMYGQGSQMQRIDELEDYFATPYYTDGMGNRPLELFVTVSGGVVTKVVWEYRP